MLWTESSGNSEDKDSIPSCKEVCVSFSVTFSGSQLHSLIAIDNICVTKPRAQRTSRL